jgi:choline dehydrogenase-like flavoprotein
MAWRLAQTGKRVLLLERGPYLPPERENWDSKAVFVDARYQAPETWFGVDDRSFHPGLHYFVGGNSKVYGAVLLRLREKDFEEIRHPDGISPAWPIDYDSLEPYYQAAEELYHVHGLRGEDPTEPRSTKGYAYPPISHEPRIQQLFDDLKREGRSPFHLPVGVLLDEKDGLALPHSPCIRCNAFAGYPCLTNGKADAQVICVDPALAANSNLSLMTNSYVEQLTTDCEGGRISGVEVIQDGERRTYRADIVVVACGALSSALLMFRSANPDHPTGLANASGLLGRNYMRHNSSVLMAVSRTPNPTRFQKTLGLNDFYFGAEDWEFPLGHIQMVGKSDGVALRGEGLSHFLQWLLKAHGIDNLYVTDASFFPSIGAVNPRLTIIANALRVGDIIAERLV